jgi:hypothetical protein
MQIQNKEFINLKVLFRQSGRTGCYKLTGAMVVHEKRGSSGHVRLLRQRA